MYPVNEYRVLITVLLYNLYKNIISNITVNENFISLSV